MPFLKTKKIIFALSAILGSLSVVFPPMAVSAAGICIPCAATSVAKTLEKRYHMNLGSVQDMSENLNVSGNKTSPPQVSLFFLPDEPRTGEKITANAAPSYFTNPKEKLYFTWYVKHDEDDDGRHGRRSCEEKEYDRNCDWNDDGDIDQEDWKIEAMRIIATGGYDNRIDEPFPDYGRDGDNDEYEAIMGGDDRKNMPSHCYVHDFEDGENCELSENRCNHLFPDSPGDNTGNGEFSAEEERFWGTNPQDPNTAGNGNLDEANVSGLGQGSFSWTYSEGDKVGVAVEGVSIIPTKYNDASFMIMWALPKNDFTCSDNGRENGLVTCPAGYVARCAETDLDFSLSGTIGGTGGGSSYLEKCRRVDADPVCDNGIAACSTGIPKCVPNGADGEITIGEYYTGDHFDFMDEDDNNASCSNDLSGLSDNQTSCEKLRFRDCDDTPTCEEDALSETGKICTGSKSVSIKGYNVNIPTAGNFDINDCLEDNLVDPAEKKFEKLDVSLSYTPNNPVNDSLDSKMGDVLSVSSMLENASQDPSHIRYEWRIEAYDGRYVNITGNLFSDGMIEKGSLENNAIAGLGLSSMDIKLNMGEDYERYFDGNVGPLKISVVARESIFGKERIGKGEIIIRTVSSDKRINAYLTNSSDGIRISRGNAICNNISGSEYDLSYYMCPVVKNQIIKLEVDRSGMSDFAWSVDGNLLECDRAAFGNECSEGNAVFLPIIGDEGQTLDVRLIAKDMEEGESVELSKRLQIVKPYIKIASGNQETFWKKLIGRFSYLNGDQYDDFSDSSFETFSGASVLLRPEFHPGWLAESGDVDIQWMLDGVEPDSGSDSREISFTADKDAGEIYNVEISSFYNSSNGIRNILNNVWNISQTDSSGESMSHAIQGEIISLDPTGSSAFKGTNKFMASLISNIPVRGVFLLRIAMTVAVVILMAGIASNFSPNFYKNKDE